jgi:hypothetical protein
VPDPTEGAYYSAKDGHALWAEYTTHEDMHRALTDWPRFGPLGNSMVAMVALLVLAWPLAWREFFAKSTRWPWLVVFTYATLSLAAIIFARVVHEFKGTEVPYVVVSWMPYRLTIHLSMILLATVSVLVTVGRRDRIPLALVAALGWLAALPLWPLVLPGNLAERYFSMPETALFLLGGTAVTALWTLLENTPTVRRVWLVTLVAGLVGLGAYHQMGLATVLAGMALGAFEGRLPGRERLPRRVMLPVAGVLGSLALLHVLTVEWREREWLPVTPFEAEMAAYLDANSEPEDMVLTPLDEHYQMVLNRPIVATFETRQFMSYMKSLATTTDKLFADLYGVRDGHWYDWDLWQARSTEAWQELARAYGFRYVLSKSFHPLHLPKRLEGDGLILYEVPE